MTSDTACLTGLAGLLSAVALAEDKEEDAGACMSLGVSQQSHLERVGELIKVQALQAHTIIASLGLISSLATLRISRILGLFSLFGLFELFSLVGANESG